MLTDSQLGGFTNEELVAEAVRLSLASSKQLAVSRVFVTLFLTPLAILVLFREAIGITLLLPAAIGGLACLILLALTPRLWRKDLRRMELVHRLSQQGLVLPAVVKPVDYSALEFMRRGLPPCIIALLGGIVALAGAIVDDLLPESPLSLWFIGLALLAILPAAAWVVTLTLWSRRGAV